jgi:hypothetical protein
MNFINGNFVGVSFVLNSSPEFIKSSYDRVTIYGSSILDKIWIIDNEFHKPEIHKKVNELNKLLTDDHRNQFLLIGREVFPLIRPLLY